MIILEPSAGIKKDTKLNYEIISNLLTNLLEYNHKRKINIVAKIHKSRTTGVSYCTPVEGKEFLINLDLSKNNRRYIFGSILHEIRHCIQKEVFKFWPSVSHMKTWRDYWYSKEEVDARKMETLTTQFIKSYDSYVKMTEMCKEKKLYKVV